MNILELTLITGEELPFIKKCLRIHSWRAHIKLRVPIKHFTIQLLSSPPPAWLFVAHHSPFPVLDKAAVKRGKSRRGGSWGEAIFV